MLNITLPSPTGDVQCFSGAGDVSTETEVKQKRRQKRAVTVRLFVPLSARQPSPLEFGSYERCTDLLEQAFCDGNDEFK